MEEILRQAASDDLKTLASSSLKLYAVDIEDGFKSEFRKAIKTDQPIGKKLDFMIQEMNRETNTMGSKANDVEISKIIVDMKSEIEKIREQIQNIE